MELVNLTPHAIVFFSLSSCVEQGGGKGYILKDGAAPLGSIPASGMVARAAMQAQAQDPVSIDGIGEIPVSVNSYGDPVGLPEPQDGIGYVVSALTAAAAKAAGRDTADLFIPNGLVRDSSGAPVGCTGLARP